MPKVQRLTTFFVAAELPLILAIAPALLFPTPGRLLVLLVLPVLWWAIRSSGHSIIPATPLNMSLWLLLTMVAVSLYATFDLALSMPKVCGIVLDVLLFWALVRWLMTPERLRIAVALFLLAGTGLAIVGPLGIDGIGKVAWIGRAVSRLGFVIRGVPGAEGGFNPNAVAGGLVLFVPLQFALLATRARTWMNPLSTKSWAVRYTIAIQVVLLSVTAGTAAAMQSRSAWLGLLLALFTVSFWKIRWLRVLTAIALAAILMTAAIAGPTKSATWIAANLGATFSAKLGVRTELWDSGLQLVKESPVLGIGMNTFRELMPARYPISDLRGRDLAHSHNQFVQAALDLGIPGLIAYTSIWILAAVLLASTCRHAADPNYRIIAGGLGAGLIAQFGFNMTDTIALGSKVGLMYWVALSLAVALHRFTVGSRRPPTARNAASD